MEKSGEDEFVVLVFGNYELRITENLGRKERKGERKGTQRNTICFKEAKGNAGRKGPISIGRGGERKGS